MYHSYKIINFCPELFCCSFSQISPSVCLFDRRIHMRMTYSSLKKSPALTQFYHIFILQICFHYNIKKRLTKSCGVLPSIVCFHRSVLFEQF